MGAAGYLRHRVAFHRAVVESAGLGPQRAGWEAEPFAVMWCRFLPERGREAIAAGRVQSAAAAEIMVRNSATARTIRPQDKCVIDGRDWNIRGVQIEARDRAYIHIRAESAE